MLWSSGHNVENLMQKCHVPHTLKIPAVVFGWGRSLDFARGIICTCMKITCCISGCFVLFILFLLLFWEGDFWYCYILHVPGLIIFQLKEKLRLAYIKLPSYYWLAKMSNILKNRTFKKYYILLLWTKIIILIFFDEITIHANKSPERINTIM